MGINNTKYRNVVRSTCYEKGIYLYELAYAYGVSDSVFSKKLRNLCKDDFEYIMQLIEKIAAGEDLGVLHQQSVKRIINAKIIAIDKKYELRRRARIERFLDSNYRYSSEFCAEHDAITNEVIKSLSESFDESQEVN